MKSECLQRTVEPFYLETAHGRIFCLFVPPDRKDAEIVVHVAPFAEEMNRSRPMVALQAREFAQRGIGCLLLDYCCTGDSSGDFRDAEWDDWKHNVVAAITWIRQEGYGLYGLWGLRLGAILATQLVAERRVDTNRLLFWQPVVDGRQMMTQFLRIRIAAQMDRGQEQENTRQVRERLNRGELLEIAGYELSGSLCAAVDAGKLIDYDLPGTVKVDWIEKTAITGEILSPQSMKVVTAWKDNGLDVHSRNFDGPPFWQLHEREMAPDIITKTMSLVQ